MKRHLIATTILMVMMSSAAAADWSFNGQPNPNAFIQTGNMSLELQCDRVRFAPAGYEDLGRHSRQARPLIPFHGERLIRGWRVPSGIR